MYTGVPEVIINEVDGALNFVPPSQGDIGAIIGPASGGDSNRPLAFVKIADVVGAFESGPLVELASMIIANTGKPVVCVKTDAESPCEMPPPTLTGTLLSGGAVVEWSPVASADDSYGVYIVFQTGGTFGSAGITFQWSLNGGRTLSAVTYMDPSMIGKPPTITLPEGGRLQLVFSTGSEVAVGDTIQVSVTAAVDSTTVLVSAFKALGKTSLDWSTAILATEADPNVFQMAHEWIDGMRKKHYYRKFLVNARDVNTVASETVDEWAAAIKGEFEGKTSVYGSVCAGFCTARSAVSREQLRVPVAWPVAVRSLQLTNPRRVDMAQVSLGRLAGEVSVVDTNGNTIEYCEDVHECGLSDGDARFIVLRMFPGRAGAYITRPWLKSPDDSDYSWWQYRALMNAIANVIDRTLTDHLRSPITPGPNGYILESDAVVIETLVNRAVSELVDREGDVAAHVFTLSRFDKILETGKLTGQERVRPLAYLDRAVVELTYDVSVGMMEAA